MPLSNDVAIIVAQDVGAATGESGLDKMLADAGNGTTLANALNKATTYVIVELKARGINPAKVANTGDLKIAAAWAVVMIAFAGQDEGDENSRQKRDFAKAQFLDQIAKYAFESTDAKTFLPPKGMPRIFQLDQEPVFNRPVDNRQPWRPLRPGYRET